MLYSGQNVTQHEKMFYTHHSIKAQEKSQHDQVPLRSMNSSCSSCASVPVLEATFSCARQLYLFCPWPCLSSSQDNSPHCISVRQKNIHQEVEWLMEAKYKWSILKEGNQETHISGTLETVCFSEWNSDCLIHLYSTDFWMPSGWACIYTASVMSGKWLEEAPCNSYLLLCSKTLLTSLTQRKNIL